MRNKLSSFRDGPTRVSAVKPKKAMHKAALDFLKLKDIPDKIEISAVKMIRTERKHARGY